MGCFMKKLLCLFGALVLVFASVGFAFADSEPIAVDGAIFNDASFSPAGYINSPVQGFTFEQPHVFVEDDEAVYYGSFLGVYPIHPGDSIVFDFGDEYDGLVAEDSIDETYESWLFGLGGSTARFDIYGLDVEDIGTYTLNGTKCTFTFDVDFSSFESDDAPEHPYMGIYDDGYDFFQTLDIGYAFDEESASSYTSLVRLCFADLDGAYIDDTEDSGEYLWLDPATESGSAVYDFTSSLAPFVTKYLAIDETIFEGEDGERYFDSESFPSGSNNVISSTGSVFSTVIGFVTSVVETITSNPLLLIFAIVSLVGLGIGMTKRIMNL